MTAISPLYTVNSCAPPTHFLIETPPVAHRVKISSKRLATISSILNNYSFKIRFNIILPSTYRSSNWSPLCEFSPMLATCPANPVVFVLITVAALYKTSGEQLVPHF